jgi:small-conductance mechanosensitive channel
MPDIRPWIGATTPIVWTVVAIAIGWLSGHAAAALARPRVARKAHRAWVACGYRALRPRLPLWGAVAAAWLAFAYWPVASPTRVVAGRLLFVTAAASVTFAAAGFASSLLENYPSAIDRVVPTTSLTRNIAWSVVATIGLLVILNALGLSIAPMLTALGVGGLAVALALQEPLANVFAGLFVSLAGQIRVGDYVRLDGGQEGYVIDFSWRSTRLRMLANNVVIVPNAKLAQAIVVNHDLPAAELAVLVEVGVDYGSNLQHVERVTCEVGRDVMREVLGGVPEFQPFIRYHTFADSSINFTAILRARTFVDQYLVRHEFVKRLHERFGREGIVIPFPIRTIVDGHQPQAAAPHRSRVSGAA